MPNMVQYTLELWENGHTYQRCVITTAYGKCISLVLLFIAFNYETNYTNVSSPTHPTPQQTETLVQ